MADARPRRNIVLAVAVHVNTLPDVPASRRIRMLLVQRNYDFKIPLDRDLWVFPGGKIEPHEGAENACARELMEETGLSSWVDGQFLMQTNSLIREDLMFTVFGYVFVGLRPQVTLERKHPPTLSGFGWFLPDEVRRLDEAMIAAELTGDLEKPPEEDSGNVAEACEEVPRILEAVQKGGWFARLLAEHVVIPNDPRSPRDVR